MAKADFYTYKHVYANADGSTNEIRRHFRNAENAKKEFENAKKFYLDNNKNQSISMMDISENGQHARFIFDNGCIAIISWFDDVFDD